MEFSLYILLTIVTFVSSTEVFQCAGRNDPDLNKRVKIWSTYGECKKSPCKVSTRRMFHLEYVFETIKEMDSVYVDVKGRYKRQLFEPEVVNVCNTVWMKPDLKKKGCPIKENQEYVYRARLRLRSKPKQVLMNLKLEGDDESVITCFEVVLDAINPYAPIGPIRGRRGIEIV